VGLTDPTLSPIVPIPPFCPDPIVVLILSFGLDPVGEYLSLSLSLSVFQSKKKKKRKERRRRKDEKR